MAYEVIWIPDAEQQLAAIWVQASDRASIAAAANNIDKRLTKDPEHEGESRAQALRILHCKPLGVDYRVLGSERQVRVLRVWSF